MDENEKIVELENQLRTLRRQLERVCQAVDETRRRVGLSNLIDDQTLAINARAHERAM